FHHDNSHTGRSPIVGAQSPNVVWRSWAGGIGCIYCTDAGSPAIGPDGTIYVGGGSQLQAVLNALSRQGSLIWSRPTGSEMPAAPAVASDGTIYFQGAPAGCTSCEYYLNALTPSGAVEWAYFTGILGTSSPTVASDGTIYVGESYSNPYAVYGYITAL